MHDELPSILPAPPLEGMAPDTVLHVVVTVGSRLLPSLPEPLPGESLGDRRARWRDQVSQLYREDNERVVRVLESAGAFSPDQNLLSGTTAAQVRYDRLQTLRDAVAGSLGSARVHVSHAVKKDA